MYLKNDSSFQCGLRTKKEVLTLNPGDAIFVLDSELLTINSCLTRITEEEYFNIKRATKKQINEVVKQEVKPTEVSPVPTQPDTQVKETELQPKQPEEVVVKQVTEVKPATTPVVDGSKEDKTDSLTELETKLEELKQQWQTAKRASKKASIQKQIKDVQDKIAKLK